MSRARALTMGTPDGRPRHRSTRPKACPLAAAVRRELRPLQHGGAVDVDALRAATVALGQRPGRLLYAEGFLYAEANRVLEELTGERPGPIVGQL